MRFTTALIQAPLLFVERNCARMKRRINRISAFGEHSKTLRSIAPLRCGLVANICVDVLKLYQILRLSLLHSQKGQNFFANPCGLLRSYRPNVLRSMLRSIWVMDFIHSQAAAEGVMQKRNSLWFTHRNDDVSGKSTSVFSSMDADASFPIDNSRRIGKISVCNWFLLKKTRLSSAFLLAFYAKAGAFCAGRKIDFGHWIFSIRWSWLMRRSNATSALFILCLSFGRCVRA